MTTGPSPEVDHAHTRLERLIGANRSIVAELALDSLMRLVVDSARDLLNAQHAVLGLTRPDGTVEHAIYSGGDESKNGYFRELTSDGGPLSYLLDNGSDDGGPARRRLFSDAPLLLNPSVGKDQTLSVMGVTVHTSSHIYGNLYLFNGTEEATFTLEDQRVAVALAATAGIAIENAHLYRESRRRQEWLRASTEISQRLLTGDDTATGALQGIAEFVKRLADADLASVVLPVPGVPNTLQVAAASGEGADDLANMQYKVDDSVAWRAMQTGHGLVVTDAGRRQGIYLHFRDVLPLQHVMAIPLKGEGAAHGAIVVARNSSGTFSEGDLEMAEAFANQATLALELAEARQDRHRLAVLEDRARIARDLHDHVVQKLFAVGLIIQSTTRTVQDPGLRTRLTGTVNDLDDTIRSIRTAIFQLQEPRSTAVSARSRVRAVLADLTVALGFGPIAQFEGPLDTMIDDELAAEVEEVLRATVLDIAEHAKASTVTVNLSTDGRELRATVSDDGAQALRGPLAGLQERATLRGGNVVTQSLNKGRMLRWTVPI